MLLSLLEYVWLDRSKRRYPPSPSQYGTCLLQSRRTEPYMYSMGEGTLTILKTGQQIKASFIMLINPSSSWNKEENTKSS